MRHGLSLRRSARLIDHAAPFLNLTEIEISQLLGCAGHRFQAERGEFAAVYSDLGHSAANSDGLWASGNPQGIRDFGSRGVHVVNLAARKIISDFYGQKPRYAYFSGCSDGGREALMSAQRYPLDFDGIVAGAPAANLTMNNSIYHAWLVQHLLAPDKKLLISDAQLAAVQTEVLRQCDGLDGARGSRGHGRLRQLRKGRQRRGLGF